MYTMPRNFKSTLAALLLPALIPLSALAQTDVTIDYASRYIWRGTDYGGSPSLQPGVRFTTGNLTFGTWAAYATNGNPAGMEIDFYLSYTLGDLSLTLTDYTFPDAAPFFDETQHFLEVGVGYSLPSIPLSLSANMFVVNDADYPIYLEAVYTVRDVAFTLGFTPTESALYANTKPGLINAGVGVGREVKITDAFSLNLSTKFITNPYANNAYLLFGVSF